jgi:hypothetical protein
MPYVIRNKVTGEIAAAVLRNIYDLDYWGAQWWDNAEEAGQAAAERADFEPLQVSDSRLKLLNVKLNNDPSRRLFLDDQGTIRVDGSAR